MKTQAAVMHAAGAPLEIGEIDLDEVGPREVRVRTLASGICHTDLSVLDASLPVMAPPIVLGHEPAGVVEEVGSIFPGSASFTDGNKNTISEFL